MNKRRLDRRTFLRGLGGTAIALPMLEIMLDDHGGALASGGPVCPRFLVAFGGQSMGGDNDPIHNLYAPDSSGPNYDLKTATASLAGHGNIANEISIISGLRIPYNDGNGIPAGGWDTEFHISALGPLLSGVRNSGPQDYGVNGPSADQVVANVLGADTVFRSLNYRAQASWYLSQSAPYGRDIISYRQDGNDILPVPGQVSPKAAFDSLFTGFVPSNPAEAAAKAYELDKRKSVIDLVRGDFDRLMPSLGQADTIRMQRHLDEIRDLEMQLGTTNPDAGGACMMLPEFGDDPPVGGNNESVGGDGFDTNNGYSQEHIRAQLFADLLHMAFVCDLSRVGTLMYTMAQSHMSTFPIAGFAYDQHEVGHSAHGTEGVSQIISWHLDLFGYLVAKLRDTPEGDGSVLDNSALVMLHEGGHGYDPGSGSENSSHSTENMICLCAGRAGGLVAGEHIPAPGLHPVNVLNTAMRAVGVEQDLGEVTGIIPGLLS